MAKSQNHATEFTPGHAGDIDQDSERLSHGVCSRGGGGTQLFLEGVCHAGFKM